MSQTIKFQFQGSSDSEGFPKDTFCPEIETIGRIIENYQILYNNPKLGPTAFFSANPESIHNRTLYELMELELGKEEPFSFYIEGHQTITYNQIFCFSNPNNPNNSEEFMISIAFKTKYDMPEVMNLIENLLEYATSILIQAEFQDFRDKDPNLMDTLREMARFFYSFYLQD